MLASVPWDLGGGGEGQSQQQFSKSFNEIFRENIVKTLNLFVLLMSSDFWLLLLNIHKHTGG